MRYAKILQNGVLIKESAFDGSKPLNEQIPQSPDGMIAIPDGWKETETEIERTWEFIEVPDEPTVEDKAEAYDILMGGAT